MQHKNSYLLLCKKKNGHLAFLIKLFINLFPSVVTRACLARAAFSHLQCIQEAAYPKRPPTYVQVNERLCEHASMQIHVHIITARCIEAYCYWSHADVIRVSLSHTETTTITVFTFHQLCQHTSQKCSSCSRNSFTTFIVILLHFSRERYVRMDWIKWVQKGRIFFSFFFHITTPIYQQFLFFFFRSFSSFHNSQLGIN